MLKATKVNGIYDKDPMKYQDAKRFSKIKYIEALRDENIQIMDKAALSLSMENKLPIIVFNLFSEGNLKRVIIGEDIGTLVEN
jgi:uridylate kinase